MRQDQPINPERPVRVHTTPRSVGQNDFEHAIQKSADVIRFHPQSRWVDNAIEIIGMSYFYQQQYFSADQKFVELLGTTSDPELRQRAILWRGRAALELENYVEGINYAQSRLFSTEFNWDPEIAAELKLVIAQLFVARGEYDDAEVYVAEALPDIRDRNLEMRSHFLHGQLLELQERYDEAFEAYNRATHQSNPNYDLIYHAELKLGIVARKQGEIDWAYEHFSSMRRDDRHYEYIAAIEYEIARTLQIQDRFTEARAMYGQILDRRVQNPSREVQAKIYYGIAEIYRDFYLDYEMTAAYFDSSAGLATNHERLPEGFDADILARSYGDYTRYSREIRHLDSLLWLGGLSQAELDSVVENIRQQKIAEMEAEARAQQRSQLISVDGIDEAGAQADEQTDNGFLNHRNPAVMQQMSQAFMAYWGQRPLVDDWRRIERVRENLIRQFEEEGEEIADIDEAVEEELAPQTQTIEVDLSEVPFSEVDREETRRRIASYEYEIGNVFYTSLAMPDSAAVYYRSVMNHYPDSDLAPQAIYSLSELYESEGDSVNALQYAMQLVDFYPGTIFAERVAERFHLDREVPDYEMTRADSISYSYESIKNMDRSPERATKLRELSLKYPDDDIAAEALYRSLLDFVETAREDETYEYRMNELNLVRTIWEQAKSEKQILRDSVRAMLADSVFMAGFPVQEQPDEPEDMDTAPLDDDTSPADDDTSLMDEDVSPADDDTSLMDEYVSPVDDINDHINDPVETDVAEISGEVSETDVAELNGEESVVDDAEPGSEISEVDDTELNGELSEVDEGMGNGEDMAVDEEAAVTRSELKFREHVERLYMRIADQLDEEPDFSGMFPYEGALWDSARVVLLTLQDNYPNFSKSSVIDALADEIEVDRIRSAMVDTSIVYSCEELDEIPQIVGGSDQFLEESGMNNIIEAQELDIRVMVVVGIDQDGRPLEAEIRNGDDHPGIMEALRRNVLEFMRFESPTVYGVPVRASCEYPLELQQ